MAILITGATGFIGRHLVRHMVEAGETDLVLMDAVPNRAAIADVAPKVRLIPGDIRETTSIVDAIRKYRIEGIIHLAAYLGTGGIRNPIPSINVNLVGTNNVFEAARLAGVKRVVYTSSNAIYPERRTLDGPRFDEDDPPGPDATNLVYGPASSSTSTSPATTWKRSGSIRSGSGRPPSSAKAAVSAAACRPTTSWSRRSWPGSASR